MAGETRPDLDRIRELTTRLGALDPGPAADLAAELATAVTALTARVDALWQLIATVVESAGLRAPAQAGPQTEFVQAVSDARRAGRRGIRVSIDGQEWVAALSHQPPAPDAASWSAIERIARESADHDEM
jgi:hypothetical protein